MKGGKELLTSLMWLKESLNEWVEVKQEQLQTIAIHLQ